MLKNGPPFGSGGCGSNNELDHTWYSKTDTQVAALLFGSQKLRRRARTGRSNINLTLVMLNKLRCHTHFQFSANQITCARLLIKNHILNDKQGRSRSVGFWRQGISGFSRTRVNVNSGSIMSVYLMHDTTVRWTIKECQLLLSHPYTTMTCLTLLTEKLNLNSNKSINPF